VKISVQSIFEIKRILLLFCLYQNYHWIPNYQEVMVIISLKNLSLPQFCACPNPEPVFQKLNFVLVFFNVQRFEVRGDCSFLFILVKMVYFTIVTCSILMKEISVLIVNLMTKHKRPVMGERLLFVAHIT
jgi:hypothetical protein